MRNYWILEFHQQLVICPPISHNQPQLIKSHLAVLFNRRELHLTRKLCNNRHYFAVFNLRRILGELKSAFPLDKSFSRGIYLPLIELNVHLNLMSHSESSQKAVESRYCRRSSMTVILSVNIAANIEWIVIIR